MKLLLLLSSCASFAATVIASPFPNGKPFHAVWSKRQSSSSSPLTVDLGYEVYQGVANATTKLNTFKGYATIYFGQELPPENL